MSEPYTPSMIRAVLRDMPDADLSKATPRQFHTWPTRKIVPSRIIAELITHERSTRGVRA